MLRAKPNKSGNSYMAVKKIQCADPDCDGVIAHQISVKTFELKRLDQAVT